ncbi:MAG TPA: hypothetical protein VMG30_16675 [Acidobacteriota bacterium]|nr:hypothetical protein [Acidobacteriota bacterium]
MAHDIEQQVISLSALPQSFWKQLKKDQDSALMGAAESARNQSIENEGDQSLKGYFSSALCYEEPTILKVYAPLIRRIRENSIAPALDFYIMVKAHLARITRVTQSFSGDPAIIQRANTLLQAFEREVQEPHMVIPEPDKKMKKGDAARSAMHKEAAKIHRKAPKKAHPLAKPAKILRRRPKPLVKKVNITRRRARR